ncbi:MAG: IS630 family transposase [Elusimicrobiota bacterium]
MFVDETGFLMAPLVRRTWARKGHTPILRQATRSHKKVSVVGALVVPARRQRVRFYFSLHRNANINASKLVHFLGNLSRQVRGRVIIVWDRLNTHRARSVQAWLHRHPRIDTTFLPPYAPELNPIELAWGHLKTNPMANWAPLSLNELAGRTGYHAARLRSKRSVLRGFLGATPLFSCPP